MRVTVKHIAAGDAWKIVVGTTDVLDAVFEKAVELIAGKMASVLVVCRNGLQALTLVRRIADAKSAGIKDGFEFADGNARRFFGQPVECRICGGDMERPKPAHLRAYWWCATCHVMADEAALRRSEDWGPDTSYVGEPERAPVPTGLKIGPGESAILDDGTIVYNGSPEPISIGDARREWDRDTGRADLEATHVEAAAKFHVAVDPTTTATEAAMRGKGV